MKDQPPATLLAPRIPSEAGRAALLTSPLHNTYCASAPFVPLSASYLRSQPSPRQQVPSAENQLRTIWRCAPEGRPPGTRTAIPPLPAPPTGRAARAPAGLSILHATLSLRWFVQMGGVARRGKVSSLRSKRTTQTPSLARAAALFVSFVPFCSVPRSQVPFVLLGFNPSPFTRPFLRGPRRGAL
jgi:hypothetical protein